MKKKDREKRNLCIRIDYLLYEFEGRTGMKVKEIVLERGEDDSPGVKIDFAD